MAQRNNRVLQTLIIGGFGIYALNKLLSLHTPTSPGGSPPGYSLTTQSDRHYLYPDFASDNFDDDTGTKSYPVDDNHNTGLKSKQWPQPESKPLPPPPPPTPKDTSTPKGKMLGRLGNLFTEVISNVVPQEAAIFYYSEKDVLDNERIFIKKMTHENAALCRAYLQWPARKMKETHTQKIFY